MIHYLSPCRGHNVTLSPQHRSKAALGGARQGHAFLLEGLGNTVIFWLQYWEREGHSQAEFIPWWGT